MKLILLSDIHLCIDKPICRLDNIVETEFEKLSFIFNYAVKNKIQNILQAGDLVDVRRSWELMSLLSKFLEKYKNENGINLYMVRGQHDSYFHDIQNDKTIVGVLSLAGLITTLSAEVTNPNPITLCNVYGASYGESVPKVTTKDHNILVIHKQILANKLFFKQTDFEYAPDFLAENNKFDLILCGDVHQQFEFYKHKRAIINTGVILRSEASEYIINHSPKFAIYDTIDRSIEWVSIPHAKAKAVISDAHLSRRKELDRNFEEFINKVKETEGNSKSLSFSRNLKLFLKRNETSDEVRGLISEYMSKVEDK